MPAMALTDFHNLFGLIKFYQKAIGEGIKPIIGADVNIKIDEEIYALTLLCQNNEGYKNLTYLLSNAYLRGQQGSGEPKIHWDWLTHHHSGLIVLSGAQFGDIGQAILNKQRELAESRIQKWKNIFDNRFYIEVQRTGRPHEEIYLQEVILLAHQHHVSVVATNDVRFLSAQDFEAHEARVCINSGHILQDQSRPKNYSPSQYLRSSEEMIQLFADIPEAIANTIEIAKRCNVQLELGKAFLPNFPVPSEISLEEYLRQKSQQGLEARLIGAEQENPNQLNLYQERLETELAVINRMGFAGYFLIVADFIEWAKKKKIPVGPGRGSGAGSLVAFCLGITALDPLIHDLLFERFLNPERISMPDFDIDFCMERRDLVIDYVAQRYGKEAVSQIITFGTMAAKAVVRDVGRVLGMPYGFVDKIAKLVPFELGITLDKALVIEEKLRERYEQEEEVTTLINLARKLEGLTRNAGKHAGGVVIAPTRLIDFSPLYCEAGGDHVVTQFDKDDVEAVGLVKFDFLGLRTLTIIDWTVNAVNKKCKNLGLPEINIETINLEDNKTFQLLKRCETTAVFQLESRGMKELIRRLQPDVFEEITALVALFRPGPLQSGMVDDFIARKHGKAVVNYLHPKLESILRHTYGVILYQEQVMQIAQELAGYSLGEADLLRRAMGKKKPEEMAQQRQIFVKGAAKNAISETLAEHIFDLMEKFAGYGFNKSHSAAYALLAYQTAWLKAHYPAEFMAAVLSSDVDHTDKVVGFLQECTRMGVKVLPPNINVGHYYFMVNSENMIEYGLGAIKGAGQAAVNAIVEEREQTGPFKSLFDFCERLDHHKVSRRIIEPLIYSGAMDVFDCPRSTLMASLDKALKAAEQKHLDLTRGQLNLFASMPMSNTTEYVLGTVWNDFARLQGEKATLGFYLSGHPLETYQKDLAVLSKLTIDDLNRYLKKEVVVGGLLENFRVMQTRKGLKMAVATFADHTARIEVTIFSNLFDEVRNTLQKEDLYLITGTVEEDQYTGGVRLVAERIQLLKEVREKQATRILLKVRKSNQIQFMTQHLPKLIEPYLGGRCFLMVEYTINEHKAYIKFGQKWCIKPADGFIKLLQQEFEKEELVLEYQ